MWLFCRSKADIQHFINLILIAQRVGAPHVASVSKHLTKQQAVFSNSTARWSHAVKVGCVIICSNIELRQRLELQTVQLVWPFPGCYSLISTKKRKKKFT